MRLASVLLEGGTSKEQMETYITKKVESLQGRRCRDNSVDPDPVDSEPDIPINPFPDEDSDDS